MKYVALLQGKQRTIEIDRIDEKFRVTVDEKTFIVDAFHPTAQSISMLIDGQTFEAGINRTQNQFSVYFFNDTIDFEMIDARKHKAAGAARTSTASGPLKIHAPMPGKVVRVTVQEHSTVQEGDALMVIEAMKMQNELKAPKSGIVSKINVKDGEAVSISQVLMVLD